MTLVKNINGTSKNRCNCGSWLKHWENYSGTPAIFCSVFGCNSSATVGAHVQIANSFIDKWYIVPMCQLHNSLSGQLEVSGTLISANVNETCGR